MPRLREAALLICLQHRMRHVCSENVFSGVRSYLTMCNGGHTVVQCPCHVRLRIRMALHIGLDFWVSTSKTNRRSMGRRNPSNKQTRNKKIVMPLLVEKHGCLCHWVEYFPRPQGKKQKKKNKVFKKHGLITSCVVKEKVVSLKLLPLENAFVLPQ